MILLDTNIISEMMKQSPTPKVIAWMNAQEIMQLVVSTVTIAEIAYGLNALPQGNRRRSLETAFNQAICEAFQHRILAFDEPAAYLYGKIMGKRKLLGRPMSVPDGQIAAIALANSAAVATRNTGDFIECELNLINPFLYKGCVVNQ